MNGLNLDKEKQLSCEICGAKYKVSWTLKSHMMKKHADRYSCHYCDEQFDSTTLLNSHLAIHECSCLECGKVLSDK